MKMTEIVIKIPEETRARLVLGVTYMQDIQAVCNAVGEGTILPKGHDNLIELGQVTNYDNLLDVPIVVPADKEKDNE